MPFVARVAVPFVHVVDVIVVRHGVVATTFAVGVRVVVVNGVGRRALVPVTVVGVVGVALVDVVGVVVVDDGGMPTALAVSVIVAVVDGMGGGHRSPFVAAAPVPTGPVLR
jgi:hypothetical protein